MMRAMGRVAGSKKEYRLRRRRSMDYALLLAASVLCVAGPSGCGGGDKERSQGKLPPPTFAETVIVSSVTGKISVELPAASRFTRLSGARRVPVGTAVDASAGVVRLVAATGTPAHVDAGNFQAGIFEIRQDRAEPGVTELRIRNDQAARKACGPASERTTGRRGSTRLFGRLLGDATGRFRTRGEFSTATTRGTKWGVRNRCDGTLTIVRRGEVVVTDLRLHKNVVVRAGHRVLIKAR
jgi:hypothetical protein